MGVAVFGMDFLAATRKVVWNGSTEVGRPLSQRLLQDHSEHGGAKLG